MGAWGAGIFENDPALDWAIDLHERGGVLPVEEALGRATEDPTAYLDADEGSMAMAAAEAVAAARGAPAPDLPEEVRSWVAGHAVVIDAGHVSLALAAVERVGDAAVSELAELWAAAEDPEAWWAGMRGLRARLGA